MTADSFGLEIVTFVVIFCCVLSNVSCQSLIGLTAETNVKLRDNVTLSCRIAQQGQQGVSGTFLWYHDDDLAFYGTDEHLFIDRHKVAVTDVSSELRIMNAHFEDRGEWKCEVPIGRTKLEIITKVIIKSPPKWHNITANKDIELSLGNSKALECFAVGDPTPVVAWIANNLAGGIVLPDGTVTEYHMGNVLHLTNVTGVYSGSYECHASNGLKPGISEKFTVKVPSAPYVTTPVSSARAPRGRSYNLGCVARSTPQITSLGSVVWMKGSSRINNDEGNYQYAISPSNDGRTPISTLTIPKVDSSSSGTYRCQFTNDHGVGSQTIEISVGPAFQPDTGASRSGSPSIFAIAHLLVMTVLYAILSAVL